MTTTDNAIEMARARGYQEGLDAAKELAWGYAGRVRLYPPGGVKHSQAIALMLERVLERAKEGDSHPRERVYPYIERANEGGLDA